MNGADAIVKALENEGVEYIFGYPGATIAPTYDSLAASKKIKHVLIRHEQHAGHAASGYARISGKPGVCMVTSGPGATNLVTGIATAYMDSIPLVCITGQVDSNLLGRDVFQEADVTGACESFTKYSYLVKDPLDLPRVIKEAFHIAGTGRPGPVLVDIPSDVQLEEADFTFPEKADIRGYKPTVKGHAGQIKRIIRELKNSERPLICAGGGIFNSGSEEVFLKFAETLNVPVVSTMMGLGSIPTGHPLYMGMVGMHGKSVANMALGKSDVLILMGARVSDRAVLLPDRIRRKTKIIHIDIDPAEIGKNLDTFLPIVGDLSKIMEQLMGYNLPRCSDEWISYLTEEKSKIKPDYADRKAGINPKAFVHKLTTKMPDDYIYVADVGQNQLWSAGNADIREGGRFLTTGGMGTMGYSISAALGAKLASVKQKKSGRFTIAVCGDGSYQMNMMELATICQEKADVKVIVMVNGKLGLVREIQTNAYDDNLYAVNLEGSPDPVAIANAYGIEGGWLRNETDTEKAMDDLLKHKGPYVLAVEVDFRESSI